MNPQRPLLIVEDSDEDFEVTAWALKQVGNTQPIIRASRAESALPHLCPPPGSGGQKPALLPYLVLLDLNLPDMDGRQLLAHVRDQAPAVPIVIVSTSSNPRDIEACYRLGAAGYICKPLSLSLFTEKIAALMHYWFSAVALPEEPA